MNIQIGDAAQTASVNTSELVVLWRRAFWLILDTCLEKYDQVRARAMCIRSMCNYIGLCNNKKLYISGVGDSKACLRKVKETLQNLQDE